LVNRSQQEEVRKKCLKYIPSYPISPKLFSKFEEGHEDLCTIYDMPVLCKQLVDKIYVPYTCGNAT